MKIGIIVYSQTGNTFSVIEKLEKSMKQKKLDVTMERIIVEGGSNPGEKFDFKIIPDVTEYDAIIFAAPTQAFSIYRVMKKHLTQTASLNGKKIAFLTTQQFSYPWMGGNHTIKQMQKLCLDKGAEITHSEVINWSKKAREDIIDAAIENPSGIFA